MMKFQDARTVLALAGIMMGGVLCPAQSAQDSPVPDAPSPNKCHNADFRVVIDVGHTVGVPGALSARGIPEYAFNLQLGTEIQQALLKAGFEKAVLMITDKAPPSGLAERAARANKMHADLFVAIHHDSVPDRLLQTWQYNGKTQYYDDDFPGYALFVSYENARRSGSLRFADLLGKALEANGLTYTPHYTWPLMGRYRHELVDAAAGVYRYDRLVVLRETQMPAVLLEAGSIVNRVEELQLGTPERRALISAAVLAAVDEFCAASRQESAQSPFGRSAASDPDRSR